MKCCFLRFGTLSSLLLGLFSAPAQVVVNCDFEGRYELLSQTVECTFSAPVDNVSFAPVVSIQTVDTGDPIYGHAARVLVDTSPCTNHWLTAWRGTPYPFSLPTFDPEHTFLSFDLLVYELHPFYIRIEYAVGSGGRSLETYVSPTTAGAFQHFTAP